MTARLHRPLPAAAAATLLVLAPLWRMGWTREDWLQLWGALDPATAPPGAAGVFPRPLGGLLWRAAVALGGDAPWAMHLLVAVAWLVLVAGLVRWHRAWGGDAAGALLAALALVAHGALAEPRLWASAANGVLAAALGVWAAWLLRGRPPRPRALLAGSALLVLAVLARADAVLLLALPLAERRGDRRPWLAAALLGAGALVWMVATGGAWTLDPAAGGRLLRLLLVPWGPPLPAAAAAALLGAGAALAVVAGRRGPGPRVRTLLATAAAATVAGSLAGWTPAGRYVLMPAVALALVLGGVSGRPRLLLVPWLALHLASAWFGHTTAGLLARSGRETALYRLLAATPPPGAPVVAVDPPPVGWRGEAADLENVVGAAWRRPIAVAVLPAGMSPPAGAAVLRWDRTAGHWTWTAAGAPPRPAHREESP